jgi:hypothetical protein|tara:strand:+ start:73 stop:207 length:135 start_codon:yes stop_codon:yes gene_type:complete
MEQSIFFSNNQMVELAMFIGQLALDGKTNWTSSQGVGGTTIHFG